MPNERTKSEFAELLESAQEQVRVISRIQQQRAELTASAQARGKKVTVTVNADNTVIDVEFTDSIAELSYAEIARAVIEAAQKASAEITRKTSELMTPIETQRARMPKLTDLLEQLSIDATGLHIPQPVDAAAAASKSVRGHRVFDGSAVPESSYDEAPRGRRGSIIDTNR
ncbi:YbaB/EbfC family nucleoid-associated protein [Nocardia sp. NBC_00416]|uniref:YbaB/EbfC family nucleoid-associated protein n=1 Tax=Nocardia sp. NBC_00416 TaxID=2975991 RepID=UPI002E21707C